MFSRCRPPRLATIDPRGFTSGTLYDAPGDPTLPYDYLGVLTANTFDGRGVLVAQVVGANAPEGSRTTVNVPDADSNIVLTTDPLGRMTATTYDVMNRPSAVTRGFGTSQAEKT
jgi:YD repeat-containing protein